MRSTQRHDESESKVAGVGNGEEVNSQTNLTCYTPSGTKWYFSRWCTHEAMVTKHTYRSSGRYNYFVDRARGYGKIHYVQTVLSLDRGTSGFKHTAAPFRSHPSRLGSFFIANIKETFY